MLNSFCIWLLCVCICGRLCMFFSFAFECELCKRNCASFCWVLHGFVLIDGDKYLTMVFAFESDVDSALLLLTTGVQWARGWGGRRQTQEEEASVAAKKVVRRHVIHGVEQPGQEAPFHTQRIIIGSKEVYVGMIEVGNWEWTVAFKCRKSSVEVICRNHMTSSRERSEARQWLVMPDKVLSLMRNFGWENFYKQILSPFLIGWMFLREPSWKYLAKLVGS